MLQFDRFYVDEFGEEGVPEVAYAYDFWNDYEWKDREDVTHYLNEALPENISPLDYTVDEKTGEAPVDVFAFSSETKTITARESYKQFMYEDFNFEIHGTAPLMYKGLDKDLEKIYNKLKHQFDIRIVSKENWFTIPPTLFFLSKCMPRIKHFHFVDTNKEVWDNVDILITTDPELLEDVPRGKKIIKVQRPYNEKIPAKNNVEIFQMVDLLGKWDEDESVFNPTDKSKAIEKLIGYKK